VTLVKGVPRGALGRHGGWERLAGEERRRKRGRGGECHAGMGWNHPRVAQMACSNRTDLPTQKGGVAVLRPRDHRPAFSVELRAADARLRNSWESGRCAVRLGERRSSQSAARRSAPRRSAALRRDDLRERPASGAPLLERVTPRGEMKIERARSTRSGERQRATRGSCSPAPSAPPLRASAPPLRPTVAASSCLLPGAQTDLGQAGSQGARSGCRDHSRRGRQRGRPGRWSSKRRRARPGPSPPQDP